MSRQRLLASIATMPSLGAPSTAFDDVLRFWFDRGVAGFRIDVCHAIVKDRELRDDPEAGPEDHPEIQKRGLRQVYSMNRPELHDVVPGSMRARMLGEDDD